MGASSFCLSVAIFAASAGIRGFGSVSALTANAPPSRTAHSDRGHHATPLGVISTARRRPREHRRRLHRWGDSGDVPTHERHAHFSELRMSPAALDDETTEATTIATDGESASEREETKNPIGRYFGSSNSFVRSTTQTDAIGRKPSPLADEGDGTLVPSEVLWPFSLLLLSQFILFIGVGAVIPTIPLYGQSIGLSGSANGIVISAPAVALLLASRAAGEYADVGRRGAMLGGMACIALADLGTALSGSLATLVLARLGLGLGRGYAEAGERGMLADLANRTPGLRGRALALQQACVALGIALGAPLGGVVVEEYGARSAFLCVSAAALVALGMYSVLPETVVGETERGDDAIEAGRASKDANEGANDNDADWTQLLKTSSTWRALALAQSGTSFGFACKIAIIPILANTYLGGATGAGLLLSAAGLAGLVGAPIGGFLSDKVGSRTAAAVAGAASGASLALVPAGLSLKGAEAMAAGEGSSSSSDFWHSILTGLGGPGAAAFAVLVLLWSVGASAQGPALTALAQERAPAGSEATALGLPRAVGDGTYIVAPSILGYVSDAVGDSVPGASCAVAGGAICLGSVALFLFASDEDAGDAK